MDIFEAFAQTYSVVGRLPHPLAIHGRAPADDVPRLSVAAHRAVTAVAAVARRVRCELRRWQIRRNTIRTLNALDDRMLADIGLPRSEIDSLARTVTDRDWKSCAAVPAVTVDLTAKVVSRSAANDNDAELAA